MLLKFSNHLLNETSPYLLQHAHNPVNWYPWGEEALNIAQTKQFPIILSIGYASCHWCHVMERESFEDEAVARFMNENFVCIKVDREERPDLDNIYMEAVQVMTGSGGWPLNVFLTPNLKPFFGGTYFPPRRIYNRMSWTEVLKAIHTSWKDHREDIVKQANEITGHISEDIAGRFRTHESEEIFTVEKVKKMVSNLMEEADYDFGGFGSAPKFPQTACLDMLLLAGHHLQIPDAVAHVHFSLKAMIDGGMYDQLGGGFCRYSTDEKWLIPHFEKMLYDNALLLSLMAKAYLVKQDLLYKDTIEETYRFLLREMKDESGGFYAALDADSDGVEGKYYVWEEDEIEKVLLDDTSLFCAIYNVTKTGNWEGKNILNKKENEDAVAKQYNISKENLSKKINEAKQKLLKVRNNRIRPRTDDKILLAWNAMLITSFCDCYAAINKMAFKDAAIQLYKYCKSTFLNSDGSLWHTCNKGKAMIKGNLDDYAFFIRSAISLQEITGDSEYLHEARRLTQYVLSHFHDGDNFFYFAHADETNLLFHKKEWMDGASPSGNSIMAYNLNYLGIIYDIPEWKSMTINMLREVDRAIQKYTSSMGSWAVLHTSITLGIWEIVVSGEVFNNLLTDVLKIYLPNKVIQSNIGAANFPLLVGKDRNVNAIHVCKNYACQPPMFSVFDLEAYVKNHLIR